LLTKSAKMPGLDGQKMSKSYGNTIFLREEPDSVEKKIKTMPTDPARVRRSDPGDPDKCPVWALHEVYSPDEVKDWVQDGCRHANIGCLDCKQPIVDAVLAELAPIRAKTVEFVEDPNIVRNIIHEGCEAARDVARDTLEEVRQVIDLNYR
jgi:tryptophanyl-tRNA synthetase